MQILDGKKYRNELLKEYKEKIERENLDIRLDIILVGDNDASKVYVKNKIKYSESVNIKANLHSLSADVSENDVIKLIEELNANEDVTGIILQSPVPSHIDFDKCAALIDPAKDVDGFTMENVFDLYMGEETLVPCTVKGIVKLLEHNGISLDGKNVCILGRSKIVGKPLALLCLSKNATVTICHSHTENISETTRKADILISAIGKPLFVTEDMVKEGAVVVDVGINRIDGKLCGDVDYENVKDKTSFITPVPGGVGPMTIAMIIDNLLVAKGRNKKWTKVLEKH